MKMKTIHGDISFALTAKEDLAINGTLSGGLTVLRDCTVFVHGSLEGTLVIETGARLVIAGCFDAFVDSNDGTLSIAGEIATPIETIPGQTRIATGTAVTLRGISQLVDSSGNMHPVGEVTAMSLSRVGCFEWDPSSGSFTPSISTDFLDLSTVFWPPAL